MARLQQVQDYRVTVPDIAGGVAAFQQSRAAQLGAERAQQAITQGEQVIQSNILAAEQAARATEDKLHDEETARMGYIVQTMKNLPDEESQNKFLQGEIASLNERGIDYTDTLDLLSMNQEDREEMVDIGYEIAKSAGHIQEGKTLAVIDATTGKHIFASESDIQMERGRYSPIPKLPSTVTKKIVNKATGKTHEIMFDKAGKKVADLGEVPTKADKSKFDKAKDIRAEISKHQKDFTAVKQAFNRVEVAAANPSPAGDLAIVFNFMKMLDPGSVVRESEFQTAADAKAWLGKAEEEGFKIPNKIRSFILKAEEGQILLPEQRADFLKTAGNLHKSTVKKNKVYRTKKVKQAKRFGLEEADIFLEEDVAPSDFKTKSDEDILGAL